MKEINIPIFFILLALLVSVLVMPSSSAYAGKEDYYDKVIVGYAIETILKEKLIEGTKNKTKWIKQCAYFPIVDKSISTNYDRNILQNTNKESADAVLGTLRSLGKHYVVKKNKEIMLGKKRNYYTSSTDYPHWYAASRRRNNDCGKLILKDKKSYIKPINEKMGTDLFFDKILGMDAGSDSKRRRRD